jgi:hypothetical protein
MAPIERCDPLVIKAMGLVFFVDETGHETFADPNYPVFGLGGCAMFGAHIDAEIRTPWLLMKAQHFGGPDVRLHAADLEGATPGQLDAIAEFFQNGRFVRFASVMHNMAQLPAGVKPYQVLAPCLLKRFEEVIIRWVPRPAEIVFVHEASDRGDELLERYIGKLAVRTDGVEIPVFQGLMEKKFGDPALEVADFVINAAGGQAKHWSQKHTDFRRDFKAVFHVADCLKSFICIDAATMEDGGR